MSGTAAPESFDADELRHDADAKMRADILAEAATAAPSLGAGNVPDLAGLLDLYYEHVVLEDLQAQDPLDLLGCALSHRMAAMHRRAGECVVRVHTPTVEENGWSNGHSIVEIVTDDMPFLVDSISAGLSVRDRGIHLVIHPTFDVRRDDDGTLLEITAVERAEEDARRLDTITESWIHFDIDRESDREELDRLAADLTGVLADVRAAVEDWPQMQQAVEQIATDMADVPIPGVGSDVQEEAAEFLRWLVDRNFTFLGYREYLLSDRPEGRAITVVPGSGRGILRGGDDHIRLVERMPEAVGSRVLDPDPLLLTKANSRSTVHRSVYLDYVGIKRFGEYGEVVGEYRFLGLYTANAYNQMVGSIPVLRAKQTYVMQLSGFAPDSHSGKDLLQFLETYPRDELFQATTQELLDTALGVLGLQERRRTRLFVRRDRYERFVSALVYLPRDRYTTTVRWRMEDILREAYDADSIEYRTRVTESVLARLHFVVRVGKGRPLPQPDHDVLESELAAAARSWEDQFADQLLEAVGEEDAGRLSARFGMAMPEAYKEAFPARTGVADIRHLDRLPAGATELNLYRPYDAGERTRRLKIYRAGESVSLSRLLPVLQQMGVEVTDERPFTLVDAHGSEYRIYDLGLVFPEVSTLVHADTVKPRFEAAFLAGWSGAVEVDRFNGLVLRAGLEWRDAVLIRALAKYMRQARVPFSQDYIEWVVLGHPQIVSDLVRLFAIRFDPDLAPSGDREELAQDLAAESSAAIDDIPSLDADRILRFMLTLIKATVRTSYFREHPRDEPFRVSLKLMPHLIEDLPEPKPLYEIWVYSPIVEGVHLRFAKVARGGVRWSDRPEDFRTEILGLVKAQAVKNTVIVPAGAKGGFYAKQLPPASDREAFTAAGRDAYTRFVSGLLDVTDNRIGDRIVCPARVVCHDDQDPYLVVAADKGTATFSDLANSIARSYDFWLGDAFASGGSDGYDHKAMGITARGAWESVKRHFRELGIDTQGEPFTCVGIGDMSGDVFGNGMLLSRCTRLVAAFDHRHIFLDPQPDPEVSYHERRRLFELPRSSWDNYDRSLISAGGGVYPRTAKAIDVTDEVREALGIAGEATSMTPQQLIHEILRARVDLLWNGGIGTYVKASSETNAEVGDKTNDAVRVDGRDLRCKVVGEGGNLGLTQRGRIEAARHGVRLNNDAVDNSAGVDTSDHEVNIKILLDDVVRRGDQTGKQRNQLLQAMTSDVADLVLQHNYGQNLALGVSRSQATTLLNVHARMIREFATSGALDRAMEFLPDDEDLREREANRQGLTSPELCVLLAYSKMTLAGQLPLERLAADPYFHGVLQRYFPPLLGERFGDLLTEHPLAAEIVRTVVVNDLVNRAGISFVFRAGEETGAGPLDTLRGYTFTRDVFDLPGLWRRVEELDNKVSTAAQDKIFLESRRLLDRSTRWLLQTHAAALDLTREVNRYGPVVAELSPELSTMLRGAELARLQTLTDQLLGLGIPQDLAEDTASLLYRFMLLDVVRVSERTDARPHDVASMYFCLSERYDVDDFLTRISTLPRTGRWEALARQALRSDLYSALASLTAQVVRSTDPNDETTERCDSWEQVNAAEVERTRKTLREIAALDGHDLASLSVALRALRTLVAQARG